MARKISNLWACIRDSDWLNFIHFPGYKYKIRLVSILKKREDQALISISTVLKFSARFTWIYEYCSYNRKLGRSQFYLLSINISPFFQILFCWHLRFNEKVRIRQLLNFKGC